MKEINKIQKGSEIYFLKDDTARQSIADLEEKIENIEIPSDSSGFNGNYENLINKPSVNGVELNGDMTLEELGIDYSNKANREELQQFVRKENGKGLSTNDFTDELKAKVVSGGINGKDGKDGYTPIKGVDYFDGVNGRDGVDGTDGYTPIKNVDYFDGEKGEKGDTYTITEADYQAIADKVNADIPSRHYVVSTEDNVEFNSSNEFIVASSIVDINGNEIVDLRVGDIVFVVDSNIPDRYFTEFASANPVQLCDYRNVPRSNTSNGITIINNNDGSFTLNGTATMNAYLPIDGYSLMNSSHKYFLRGWTATNVGITDFSRSYTEDVILQGSLMNFGASYPRIRISGGVTVTNVTIHPQIIDLTETFGQGNEPSIAEFNNLYPNEYYGFNAVKSDKAFKMAAIETIKPNIPAKTSELINDSGFLTTDDVKQIVDEELGVIVNGEF